MREMARKEGAAVAQSLEHFLAEKKGAKAKAGGMIIAVATEPAQGWWEKSELGELTWRDAAPDENQHIEIFVLDAEDQRVIPNLSVEVTLIDEYGESLMTKRHKFFWHPLAYHYDSNWLVPGEGFYDIRVHIDSPDFPRHGRDEGRRYAKPVDVTLEGLYMKPGRE